MKIKQAFMAAYASVHVIRFGVITAAANVFKLEQSQFL